MNKKIVQKSAALVLEGIVSYKLALARGTCHLPLGGLNHVAADLQHPRREGQGGEQKPGHLCCGGGDWGRCQAFR